MQSLLRLKNQRPVPLTPCCGALRRCALWGQGVARRGGNMWAAVIATRAGGTSMPIVDPYADLVPATDGPLVGGLP